jgi:UDP-N-acetylglucosamine diphosphorylase / glucose-1-phosphate thymidylyltransferase / UDP-N-acetylgalactosamine diphosphorylase / glucosamine-1-phosphate N-acetyltransferase / galactosamine-1-phosphate N-acetyltransferase
MNDLSLVSGPFSEDFFPFSLTRSVADIRCGILTIREKWNIHLENNPHLAGVHSIPANIIPSSTLIGSLSTEISESTLEQSSRLLNVADILRFNDREMKNDFKLLTAGRRSAPISPTNKLTGTEIFLEAGAKAEHCYLNADEGPIYIGKDALLMEGSMIRGPFAIGEKGVVKMGSKIYGATSAGPHCVLGGEIKNSIIFGYSNKAHDGYLGDSVIGAWCNLGAGSSNSNIKNSGGQVKLWNPLKKSFIDGGLKCGLLMGDYSRSAIQTAFNTGAVVGVSCHVFGNGLTPAYLPSFTWGLHGTRYDFDKAIQHISKWKSLKGKELKPDEITNLKNIFDQQKQLE